MIEKEIFKKCIPDYDKLLAYGFIIKNNNYIFEKEIYNNQFNIVITISSDGCIYGEIYDLDSKELYTNFRVENNTGEFAGTIRIIFIDLLEDIRDKCFFTQHFVSSQANRIGNLIKKKYGDVPYFEWESTPNCGVFKNKDTKKWYALIMNINKDKLDVGNEKIDIVNLKIDDKKHSEFLKIDGIYPAYHMNKKYWLSVVLDDSLDDFYIMKLIDESYQYSKGKK